MNQNPYDAPVARQDECAQGPHSSATTVDFMWVAGLHAAFALPAGLLLAVSWHCFTQSRETIDLLNMIGPFVAVGGHLVCFGVLWIVAHCLARMMTANRLPVATLWIISGLLGLIYMGSAVLSWYLIFAAAMDF